MCVHVVKEIRRTVVVMEMLSLLLMLSAYLCTVHSKTAPYGDKMGRFKRIIPIEVKLFYTEGFLLV